MRILESAVAWEVSVGFHIVGLALERMRTSSCPLFKDAGSTQRQRKFSIGRAIVWFYPLVY